MLSVLRGDKAEDGDPTGADFTPSRLLGCFRQPILEAQYDYWVNVHWQKASLRGTLIHAGFEHIGWPGGEAIQEQRMSVVVDTAYGPQNFSAKPDLIVIHPDDTFDLWDWKTRDFKHELVRADTKHIAQIWMYAYIVQRYAREVLNRQLTVRSVNICYMSWNNFRTFTSLGPGTATGKKPRGGEAEILELAAIPTVHADATEAFIRRQIERKIDARDNMPAPLEGDAAQWCFRCPVFRKCQELAAVEEEAA